MTEENKTVDTETPETVAEVKEEKVENAEWTEETSENEGTTERKFFRGKERHSKRPERKEKPKKEFEELLLEVRRVTRVTTGGRRMSFRATIVVGNKKGKIGVGVAPHFAEAESCCVILKVLLTINLWFSWSVGYIETCCTTVGVAIKYLNKSVNTIAITIQTIHSTMFCVLSLICFLFFLFSILSSSKVITPFYILMIIIVLTIIFIFF